MKRFIAALLFLPILAFAGPNDVVTNQRNAADTGAIPRTVAKPPGTQDGIMGYKAVTPDGPRPFHWTVGAGLAISADALTALPQGWDQITGKPALSAVATSGSYGDLTNKPALFSGAYGSLTGVPASFTPAAHNQAWSTITATPTTLSGYGITDAASTSSVASALAGKLNNPTGTTSQYLRGDGSLSTLPAARRIETYAGTTDANGLITVIYPSAYPVTPNVQPAPPTAANQVWVMVSSTASGFSLRLTQRASATVVGLEVLLAATTNVSGAPAQVMVVAQ